MKILVSVLAVCFGALALSTVPASAQSCPRGQTYQCISFTQRCQQCRVCDEYDKNNVCLRSHVEECNCGTVCLQYGCQ
jgi:hypothetical protein